MVCSARDYISLMQERINLYVGDDEGDVVIKFYEALAKKYGYTITALKREEQVAYTQLFESVK